ncbi:hypothetical protein CCZ01_08520 [Helicobacter monodelphidis]|uniref:hypothetical protein n=1 Tax=Helicobacter sp. 15-1451 TaxID=2004995 RepID=UPI000DCE323A|nr:hypothetical protein [Helicobacter sp. 15-1451]RAX56740.1 hypothetical protein CCZ01_08520 [Helicobacter sp. 15-1451]
MKKIISVFAIFLQSIFGLDAMFEPLLQGANLNHFAEYAIVQEQKNLSLFSQEIEKFSCLSQEGKSLALQEIQQMLIHNRKDSESLKVLINQSMEQYLQENITQEELKVLNEFFLSAYGKKLTLFFTQNSKDLINYGQEALQQISQEEWNEIKKQWSDKNINMTEILYNKFAAPAIKLRILSYLGTQEEGKRLRERIQKLQKIFMNEGCGID